MKKTFDLWVYSHPTLKKLIMVLKISVLIILVSVSNALATRGYSQVAKVTLDMKNTSLEQVMDKIEKQSEFYFIFNQKQIDVNRTVDIHVENKLITDILPELFKGTNVNYVVFDRKILLTTDPLENRLLAIASGPEPQQKQITGTVTDKDGTPLPGATVVVTGTNRGTLTDITGKYSIEVPQGSKSLTFSFTGMESQEISIGTLTQINVTLSASTVGLDEVVVVGYGTQRKSDLTGNISTVKSENIKSLSLHSVAEALQGKVAGVVASKNDGAPGSGTYLNIHGEGSINGTSPLFIVDGVPSGTGNNFNIKDIESIEIIKDGSSAAIYGVGSAGGVIIITTKRGNPDEKVKIDFSMLVGQHKAMKLPSLLNRDDYIKYKKEALVNSGAAYPLEWDNPALVAQMNNTDWKDVMYSGKGIEQEYNLAATGGSKYSNYYVSLNYNNQGGSFPNDFFTRYALRANSDFKIGKQIKIGESIYFDRTINRPSGSTDIWRITPLVPVFDQTNPVGGWGRSGGGGGNPRGFTEVIKNYNYNADFSGNIFAEIEIIKGLTFKTILSAGYNNYTQENSTSPYDFGGLKNLNATLYRENDNGLNLRATEYLTYDRTFGKHEVKIMVGYEASKGDGYSLNLSNTGGFYFTEPHSFGVALNPSGINGGGNYNIAGRTIAQFGRLNYSFAGKYLLTANIRRDGSSDFGPDKRYGVFPGVSAAWRISEESFMKDNLPFISNLKLRAGYALTGNTGGVGSYNYISNYVSGSNANSYYTFDNTASGIVSGIAVGRFPNQNISWETVKQTNFGLDFGFLEGKLTGSVDYYIKKTENMIYPVPVSVMTGVGAPNAFVQNVNTNIGTMENKGVDITLAYNKKAGDFSYGIGFIAGFFKNKITKLSLSSNYFYNGYYGIDGMPGGICRTEVGQPMAQFYGYEVDHIRQVGESYTVHAFNDPQPGDFIYRDLDGNDTINEKDRKVLGSPYPKMTYGISLSASYKGFDLNAFFDGVYGVDIYDATTPIYQSFFNDYNATYDIEGYWTPTNQGASKPRLVYGDPSGNLKTISSYLVHKGGYLKLRSLQIGYNFPLELISKVGISKARVFVAGQNLFTISSYKGRDPELGGGTTARGIDNIGQYPQNRFISLGVELSF